MLGELTDGFQAQRTMLSIIHPSALRLNCCDQSPAGPWKSHAPYLRLPFTPARVFINILPMSSIRCSGPICILSCFWAMQLLAGGSGLNVVVVVNQASTNSVALGNYYCEKRL